jgi:hypothetical protein
VRERLDLFTHWVVDREPRVKEMVELLWTHSMIIAVVPSEESGDLVLFIDQAGWDLLAEAGIAEAATGTGRVLTSGNLDDLANEAERGYDVIGTDPVTELERGRWK